ncbi:MAG: DUF4388 domain-containing protein [Scytolyngbya sp. HA4215-MV1]|jgi:hypothetical protein|nr:DUF4388 domain-containing protein [Scytolyngbya sp. HA4215-MV1]
MSVSGRLSEFSLGEIFQLLERGQKTGLLTIRAAHSPAEPLQNFYLWFKQGQILAAANRLDYKGLATLLYQREWLGEHSKMLLVEAFKSNRPLGLYLKYQKLLNAEQLKLLFYTQVIRQVCTIFQFSEGWFNFETKTELPLAEMTGLSAVPLNVTLEGLRALRDWRSLSKKLPAPNSAITSLIVGNPQLKINPVEWQVWEFANGTEPLTVIAEQLQLPLGKIQQIAFRLMMVGLIEEVPLVVSKPSKAPEIEIQNPELITPNHKPISQSFLHNLAVFLGSRSIH